MSWRRSNWANSGRCARPGQFREDAAEEDEPEDVGDRGERRDAGTQCGHPAEDVWIAAQLIERDDLGVMSAEPGEEARAVPRY